MNNVSIYIDAVAAVGVRAEGNLSGTTGTLELRVVSRDSLGPCIATTSVMLRAWRARDWDMLRDIARAIETAQSARAADEVAAEEALIASLPQV